MLFHNNRTDSITDDPHSWVEERTDKVVGSEVKDLTGGRIVGMGTAETCLDPLFASPSPFGNGGKVLASAEIDVVDVLRCDAE